MRASRASSLMVDHRWSRHKQKVKIFVLSLEPGAITQHPRFRAQEDSVTGRTAYSFPQPEISAQVDLAVKWNRHARATRGRYVVRLHAKTNDARSLLLRASIRLIRD